MTSSVPCVLPYDSYEGKKFGYRVFLFRRDLGSSHVSVRIHLEMHDPSDEMLGHVGILGRLLQILDLRRCEAITDGGVAHLAELTSLQLLTLCGCETITDGGVAHLTELKSLQSLDLSGGEEITDGGVAHLADLKTLRSLDLSGCRQITDGGVAHLRELTSLQSLDLGLLLLLSPK